MDDLVKEMSTLFRDIRNWEAKNAVLPSGPTDTQIEDLARLAIRAVVLFKRVTA
jgi:hypothetical protein